MSYRLPLALLALAAPLAASDPFEGNGIGGAFITVTPATIGGNLEAVLGTSDPVNTGSTVLSVSSGYGPIFFPGIGDVALDVFAPVYFIVSYVLDGNDEVAISFPIANNPSLVGAFGPLFADALTIDSFQISLSKTVRISWENADSFSPLEGVMSTPRLGQTATSLADDPRDNRHKVLITGGAVGSIVTPSPTASTEFFQPLSRSFDAGPDMSVPRTAHTATKLQDGRVMIIGGVTSSGAAVASTEFFDPETDTFSAGPNLASMRSGHTSSLLPDGRVLVTGGFSDWTDAANNFLARLNTSQRSTEIYDPLTNSFSAGPDMLDDRSGHCAVTLDDGTILLVSGINGGTTDQFGQGGQFPTYTPTCEIFNPANNTLTPTSNLFPSRAFAGASLLGNGDVLMSGGVVAGGQAGEAVATNDCRRWSAGAWAQAGAMTETASFHAQVTMPDGNALIAGGYVGDLSLLAGNSQVGVHDGTSFSARTTLGVNPSLPLSTAAPRGALSLTALQDGTYLVLGGSGAPDIFTTTTFDNGFIYIP